VVVVVDTMIPMAVVALESFISDIP
jgi:hypothetical protein